MEITNEMVGSAIKQLREDAQMSFMDLSFELDISINHLYQVEEGHRGIGMRMLKNLMVTFDTDANTILGISQNTNNQRKNSSSLIENKLAMLPEGTRKYLETFFEQMIDHEMMLLQAG